MPQAAGQAEQVSGRTRWQGGHGLNPEQALSQRTLAASAKLHGSIAQALSAFPCRMSTVGKIGDLNPLTSHANGGNPTASTLGTATVGSGGNQVSQPVRPVARAHSPPQRPEGGRSERLGKVPRAAGAGRPGFGENPVAWWPWPEPRAKPFSRAPSQRIDI